MADAGIDVAQAASFHLPRQPRLALSIPAPLALSQPDAEARVMDELMAQLLSGECGSWLEFILSRWRAVDALQYTPPHELLTAWAADHLTPAHELVTTAFTRLRSVLTRLCCAGLTYLASDVPHAASTHRGSISAPIHAEFVARHAAGEVPAVCT